MRIHSMRELAAVVRAERKSHGLSQAMLAKQAGVGRDWIIGLEQGKSTAEIGLVLRTLRSLGLDIQLGRTPKAQDPDGIDLNEILERGTGKP